MQKNEIVCKKSHKKSPSICLKKLYLWLFVLSITFSKKNLNLITRLTTVFLSNINLLLIFSDMACIKHYFDEKTPVDRRIILAYSSNYF